MKRLFSLLLVLAGFVSAAGTADAQYYGYRYGAQYFNWNPGYGYGYPGYYTGYGPAVVSPYYRPYIVAPSYSYSNYFAFRVTPYGFNYATSQASWVSGGLYNPYVYPAYYPGYYGAAPAILPAAAVVPEPVAVVPRTRIYRGFVPTANVLGGGYVMPAVDPVNTGSFTAWGAYMPGTGTFYNPFNGAVVR